MTLSTEFKIPLTTAQISRIWNLSAEANIRMDGDANGSPKPGLYAPVYRYISAEIQNGNIELPNTPQGQQTAFWFQRAAEINARADTAANFLIREVTRRGLEYDIGKPITEPGLLETRLQLTSNQIGRRVTADLLENGVQNVAAMLSKDIGAAISLGGQTLAGWGGMLISA